MRGSTDTFQKMASEPGVPNDEAARDLPLQRCGIKALAGVPTEAFAATRRRNWVVTRISRPFHRGRDFFMGI